jgi:hypothetical protein
MRARFDRKVSTRDVTKPVDRFVVVCHVVVSSGRERSATGDLRGEGMPSYEKPTSPLERAQEARHGRDLEGASWAPTRAGDRLVVTYEPVGDTSGFTETLEVVSSGDEDWPEQMQLRLVEHTSPRGEDHVAWFAGPPDCWGGDAIETAWMEAGPDRLALIRGEEVLHQGRHALTGPAAPERDVEAIAAASKFIKHATTPMGGSYKRCICPKEPCGGVAHERTGCPEHDKNPCQVWHWAAECPGR